MTQTQAASIQVKKGGQLTHGTRRPHLRQLGDLLAHLQVQVLGVFHSDAGLEGHGAGCGGRAEFALSGRAVILLPARPGRHLQRDVSDASEEASWAGAATDVAAPGPNHGKYSEQTAS